jgi:hypothetical protein
MFIVKTAPSANEETLVRPAPPPDEPFRTGVRHARRAGRARRGAPLAVIEHPRAPFRPAASGRSPSEEGMRREREAA